MTDGPTDATAGTPLRQLRRKTDRGGDLALLHAVFDATAVATLSTVHLDLPWSVPMLVVRDEDRLLFHGSTGAGALGAVASGAPVTVSAHVLDGLVVAARQFDHSANYRSAVVRGRCAPITGPGLSAALDLFTERLLPGRAGECPPHTRKELAQTLLLALPIEDGSWTAKQRSGPAAPADDWTGVIPVRTGWGPVQAAGPGPVPESVLRLTGQR